MDDEAGGTEAALRDKPAFRFFDLPPEVQYGVIAQVRSTPACSAESQGSLCLRIAPALRKLWRFVR
jgi:hypothetical protein